MTLYANICSFLHKILQVMTHLHPVHWSLTLMKLKTMSGIIISTLRSIFANQVLVPCCVLWLNRFVVCLYFNLVSFCLFLCVFH